MANGEAYEEPITLGQFSVMHGALFARWAEAHDADDFREFVDAHMALMDLEGRFPGFYERSHLQTEEPADRENWGSDYNLPGGIYVPKGIGKAVLEPMADEGAET